MPAYLITESGQPPFDVKWEELMGWFLIPKPGEELSWGMYDIPSRECSHVYDMQVTGKADFIAQYLESGDLYGIIVSIIKTMPGAPVIMVVVLLTMIAFYATSIDSIALTASCYSYHTLRDGEQPNKGIQLMWCILLILLPIALLFAESSMNNLQSVSIVAAFPIGAVIVMIAVSFMKDAKKYMENMEEKGQQEVDNVDNEK